VVSQEIFGSLDQRFHVVQHVLLYLFDTLHELLPLVAPRLAQPYQIGHLLQLTQSLLADLFDAVESSFQLAQLLDESVILEAGVLASLCIFLHVG